MGPTVRVPELLRRGRVVGWLAASLLVAAASYELYEKHFLRLKDRFTPQETNAGAGDLARSSSAA